MCADVLRRLREFVPLQNAECAPLDLAEGNRVGNAAVKEHVQYLADALNAFVALLLKGKNLLLHTLLGGGIHFANLVDQGVDQIVVDLPVTLPKEAQQIEACHAGGQLLQLLHGVVIDERGIVGKTVVRDPQFRNQRFRRIVQNCQGAAPRDFTLGLTQREVLGIAFQRRDDRISQLLAWVTNNTNVLRLRKRVRPEGVTQLALRRRLQAVRAKGDQMNAAQLREELDKASQLVAEQSEWINTLEDGNTELESELSDIKEKLGDEREGLKNQNYVI